MSGNEKIFPPPKCDIRINLGEGVRGCSDGDRGDALLDNRDLKQGRRRRQENVAKK